MKKWLLGIGGFVLIVMGGGFAMVVSFMRQSNAAIGAAGVTGDSAIIVGIIMALFGLVVVIRASLTVKELDVDVGPVGVKLSDAAPEATPQEAPAVPPAAPQPPAEPQAGAPK